MKRETTNDRRPGRAASLRAASTLAAVLAAAGPTAAQSYMIEELPPLRGNMSFGCGINDDGAVVGMSYDGTTGRPTRWDAATPAGLAALPGWTVSIPLDISSDGSLIVGEVYPAGGPAAAVWENGIPSALPLPPGAAGGAWELNDSGLIVGRASDAASPGTNPIACSWEKTAGAWTFAALAPLPGDEGAAAFGVNASGEVAGRSVAPVSGDYSAVRWQGGLPAPAAGTAGIFASFNGINDAGVAVGFGRVSGAERRAVLHDATSLIELEMVSAAGLEESIATRINGRGTIIGQAYALGVDPTEFPDADKLALVWRGPSHEVAVVNDLIPPGSGWHVTQLWDINASGQISGMGLLHGQWRALRLTPVCYADCDGSGSLDFFDFLCFQNLFAAGDPQADCDESGELDFFDFLCFQNQFAAGCP